MLEGKLKRPYSKSVGADQVFDPEPPKKIHGQKKPKGALNQTEASMPSFHENTFYDKHRWPLRFLWQATKQRP